MKKFSTYDLAAIIVWLLPMAYLAFIYQQLPATVPLHYGINGHADRYGSKHEFVGFQALLSGVTVFVYLLLRFLPAIDPKKQVSVGQDTFLKLAVGIVLFLSGLSAAIIFATANRSFRIDQVIFPFIGLFFAFMGNIMYNIKPNYFAGIRTPWTLEDANNWRATHRLAGKLWFVGGLLIAVVSLMVHGVAGFAFFISAMVVLTLVPTIYSYIYFRSHRADV